MGTQSLHVVKPKGAREKDGAHAQVALQISRTTERERKTHRDIRDASDIVIDRSVLDERAGSNRSGSGEQTRNEHSGHAHPSRAAALRVRRHRSARGATSFREQSKMFVR